MQTKLVSKPFNFTYRNADKEVKKYRSDAKSRIKFERRIYQTKNSPADMLVDKIDLQKWSDIQFLFDGIHAHNNLNALEIFLEYRF